MTAEQAVKRFIAAADRCERGVTAEQAVKRSVCMDMELSMAVTAEQAVKRCDDGTDEPGRAGDRRAGG